MCLSIKVNFPERVLAEGKHLGHEWVVVHNGLGYRCGYVKVSKNHPWYGKGYGDIDVDVHGGLTFAQKDVPCDKGGKDDGFWVGFDAGHCFDAQDPTLPTYFKMPMLIPGQIIRTQQYVENECKKLCEQAKKAYERT